EYEGPTAEITITRAGKVKVRSTWLYQDLVAAVFLDLIPDDNFTLSGIVLAYEPLDETLTEVGIKAEPFKKKPRTQLFQSKISGTYSKQQGQILYDEIGENAYIFCNLTTKSGWNHKSKSKIPSAQKEPPIAEQLKYSSTQVPAGTEFVAELIRALVPDFHDDIPENFSTLRIENTYEIQELVFPPNKDQLTSKEIRLNTKRQGILHRKLTIDEKEYTNKHPLIA
ncbi:MAG: hypothetical protein ACFFD8_01300, partial [Candidatus Thorarchaeota archaeon]